MGFQNRLKEIFFRMAGTSFPYARRRFYEDRARDNYKSAMVFLNGRDQLGKRTAPNPELAKAHFEQALAMLDKTERLPVSEYYHEVFGVQKEEFDLDVLEAKFQIDHQRNPERMNEYFTHNRD